MIFNGVPLYSLPPWLASPPLCPFRPPPMSSSSKMGRQHSTPADRPPKAPAHLGGLGDTPHPHRVPPHQTVHARRARPARIPAARPRHRGTPRLRVWRVEHGRRRGLRRRGVGPRARLCGRPIRVSATGGGGRGGDRGGSGGSGSGGGDGTVGGGGAGGAPRRPRPLRRHALMSATLRPRASEGDAASLGDAFRCFDRILDGNLARPPAGDSGGGGGCGDAAAAPARRIGSVRVATLGGGDAAAGGGLGGHALAARPLVVRAALKHRGPGRASATPRRQSGRSRPSPRWRRARWRWRRGRRWWCRRRRLGWGRGVRRAHPGAEGCGGGAG